MQNGLVKLCGVYQNEGKNGTYFVGALTYSSKLLILPNRDKKGEKEPDFWVFVTERQPKPQAAAAPDTGGIAVGDYPVKGRK